MLSQSLLATLSVTLTLLLPLTAANALVPRDEVKGGEGDFAIAACSCKRVSNPGLYCGHCRASPAGSGVGPGNNYINTIPLNNVAWCNTSGGCVDYGYAQNCANRIARGCQGVDAW